MRVIFIFLCMMALLAREPLQAETRAAATAPPLKIDLDAFDAQKKTLALPDGEVLAYIDTGNAAGPPVVLIHGHNPFWEDPPAVAVVINDFLTD